MIEYPFQLVSGADVAVVAVVAGSRCTTMSIAHNRTPARANGVQAASSTYPAGYCGRCCQVGRPTVAAVATPTLRRGHD